MNTANSLQTLLANIYALTLKTHFYHWNVTGTQFFQLHTYFQEQYEALFRAADTVAERIRALGVKAKGGLTALASMSFIGEPAVGSTEDIICDLVTDHRKIVHHAKQCLELARKYEDEATINLMAERITYHDKQAWMLEAYLEGSCEGCGCRTAA